MPDQAPAVEPAEPLQHKTERDNLFEDDEAL